MEARDRVKNFAYSLNHLEDGTSRKLGFGAYVKYTTKHLHQHGSCHFALNRF